MNDSGRLNLRHLAFRFIVISPFIALPLCYAAGQAGTPKEPVANAAAGPLPEGPGKDLVLKDCQSCHSIQNVTSRHGTADDWAQVVSQMIGRGANLSDDDADTIVDYLATHFGPSSSAPAPSLLSGGAPHSASSLIRPRPPADKTGGSGIAIDVNKASSDQLQSELGLTQEQATAVVDYRKQNGIFKNLQQLLSVPGIDAAKLENEQNRIAF